MKNTNTPALFDITPELMSSNHDLVREQLHQYLERTGSSQTVVAKAIDFSTGALSSFLKNTYKGDSNAIATRLVDFLNLETQRQAAPKAPEFVMTNFANHILSLAGYAHVNKDIGLINGDAGVGKTFTLEHYVKTHPGVIFITAGPGMASPKAIIEEIMDQLGCKEYGTLNRMIKVIINVLKGSGRLIIIDEATHLTMLSRETLRSIHDQAEIGIVYCGTHELYKQMYGSHGQVYAQLLSRVGVTRALHRKNITKDDIRLIFEQSGKLNSECINLLYERSHGEGGLRFARKMYMLGSTLAFSEGKELEIDHLQEALSMVMGKASSSVAV